jgi:hypothetical protein
VALLTPALLELKVFRALTEPPENTVEMMGPDHATCTALRVLPSMPLRTLRARIAKAFHYNPRNVTVHIWMQMRDGQLAELGEERDKHELDWIGLDEEATVVVRVEER